MTRYQVLLVAEIDCGHADGSDLQNKLDEFRFKMDNNDMGGVVLYRATPDDVNNLDYGTDGSWVAAHLAPTQPERETDDEG